MFKHKVYLVPDHLRLKVNDQLYSCVGKQLRCHLYFQKGGPEGALGVSHYSVYSDSLLLSAAKEVSADYRTLDSRTAEYFSPWLWNGGSVLNLLMTVGGGLGVCHCSLHVQVCGSGEGFVGDAVGIWGS